MLKFPDPGRLSNEICADDGPGLLQWNWAKRRDGYRNLMRERDIIYIYMFLYIYISYIFLGSTCSLKSCATLADGTKLVDPGKEVRTM